MFSQHSPELKITNTYAERRQCAYSDQFNSVLKSSLFIDVMLIDTPIRDAEGDVDEAVRKRPVRRHGHRRDPGAGGAARLQLYVQGADGRQQRKPRQADR